MRRLLPFVLSLFVLSIFASPVMAQEAQSFGEVVDVEVVNLEVYATKKNGDPVLNLSRDDFELFAGGEKVEITNFYAVENGRRDTVENGRRDASAAAPDPIFLAVYVDNTHLGQFTRNRLLTELRGFLKERLDEGDQVMLVSFDGGMRVHQSFTREWQLVGDAVSAIEKEPGYGHLRERERLSVLEDMISIADTTFNSARCTDDFERLARSYAQEAFSQVHNSVKGLSQFVSTLASLPGRKALLYISDGLPFQPGIGVYEFLNQYCGGTTGGLGPDSVNPPVTPNTGNGIANTGLGGDGPDLGGALGVLDPVLNVDRTETRQTGLAMSMINTTSLFDELTREANAHRVTFFPLEAYGPRALSASDTRVRSRRTLSHQADEARWVSLRDSLTSMADVTGGRAVINTAEFEPALAQVHQDLGTYYSLGYSLPKSDRGQTVRVDVKTKRRDAQIRHRKSLRSQPLAAELVGRTQAALIYGIVDNPLAIKVQAGESQSMDGDMHVVPIRVSIPLGKITLLPEGETHRGHLKLYLAGRDVHGRLAQVRTTEIPIDIPSDKIEKARQQYYLYEVRMLMRQGDHTVAVGLHDQVGSIASFLSGDVKIVRN